MGSTGRLRVDNTGESHKLSPLPGNEITCDLGKNHGCRSSVSCFQCDRLQLTSTILMTETNLGVQDLGQCQQGYHGLQALALLMHPLGTLKSTLYELLRSLPKRKKRRRCAQPSQLLLGLVPPVSFVVLVPHVSPFQESVCHILHERASQCDDSRIFHCLQESRQIHITCELVQGHLPLHVLMITIYLSSMKRKAKI